MFFVRLAQTYRVRFPALPWDYSLMENYSTACTNRVFMCFSILCSYTVQYCLRRRPLKSAGLRSGKVLELCPCWCIIIPLHRDKMYKEKLKKNNNNKKYDVYVHNLHKVSFFRVLNNAEAWD